MMLTDIYGSVFIRISYFAKSYTVMLCAFFAILSALTFVFALCSR